MTRRFRYWWRFKNSFTIRKKERKERKEKKQEKKEKSDEMVNCRNYLTD